MTAPLLYPCHHCDRGAPTAVLVDGKQLCLPCWLAAGRPWPKVGLNAAEFHQALTAMRERMMQHGGAFANAVRNGKT